MRYKSHRPALARVGDSSLCFWDLRLALKDLRLDLRLQHKDLRLTRDSTLKTLHSLATCKSLCYSRVVIKDELGNISMRSGEGLYLLRLLVRQLNAFSVTEASSCVHTWPDCQTECSVTWFFWSATICKNTWLEIDYSNVNCRSCSTQFSVLLGAFCTIECFLSVVIWLNFCTFTDLAFWIIMLGLALEVTD